MKIFVENNLRLPTCRKGTRLGGTRGLARYLPRTVGFQWLAAFCLLLSADCLLPFACGQNAEPAPAQKPAPIASHVDPKAKDILDRAIRSLGGQAFLQAKSVSTRGRTFAISEGIAAGFAPFRSIVVFPDKRHFSYGKNKPVTLLNDGERGWQLDQFGTVRQSAEQVRRWKIGSRYGYENLLRSIIAEEGVLIQDAGRDFTDNLAARVIEITDAQQIHIRLYVHAVNYRPLRLTYRVQNPESHDWEEFAEVYSDYRTFQDIDTPMHITRYLNGERYSEVFRNAVEYNAEVPPNSFTPGS